VIEPFNAQDFLSQQEVFERVMRVRQISKITAGPDRGLTIKEFYTSAQSRDGLTSFVQVHLQ